MVSKISTTLELIHGAVILFDERGYLHKIKSVNEAIKEMKRSPYAYIFQRIFHQQALLLPPKKTDKTRCAIVCMDYWTRRDHIMPDAACYSTHTLGS